MLRKMSHHMALIAALALGGCASGVVAFKAPLISTTDTQGGPLWRPGVWTAAEAGCAFDRGAPLDEWPDCSHAVVVGREGAPQRYAHQAVRPLRFDDRGQMVEARATSDQPMTAPQTVRWERTARWWRGETLRAGPGEGPLLADHPVAGTAQGAATQVASGPSR